MTRNPSDPHVFSASEAIVSLSSSDIAPLRDRAAESDIQRVRFCAHRSPEEPVQEMIIALARNTYVRPHRHIGKSESFHVIEGEADVVLFRDDGDIERVVRLGDFRSGRCFFFRASDAGFHTVVVRSDLLMMHETTKGPFRREETTPAPWAPDERDRAAADAYLRRLREHAASWNQDSQGDSASGVHP